MCQEQKNKFYSYQPKPFSVLSYAAIILIIHKSHAKIGPYSYTVSPEYSYR